MHDVADDGAIVRSNRFELVFTSATRQLITEVQSALFTPLFTGGQLDLRSYARPASQQIVYVKGPNGQMIPTVQNVPAGFGGEITHSEPAAVQGRVPTRYRVIQDVRQWTPQLNRRFSIGPPADVPTIDWQALTIPKAADQSSLSSEGFQELLAQLRSQLGPQVQLAVLSSVAQIVNTDPNPSVRPVPYQNDPYQRQFQYEQQLQLQQQLQNQNSAQNAGILFPQQTSSPQINALLRLTSAPPLGLASLTSHTSPHGGRSLDDLPLTVTGSADRWWLVIMVPQGDDLVVFRKSFRYSTDPSRPMLSPEKL